MIAGGQNPKEKDSHTSNNRTHWLNVWRNKLRSRSGMELAKARARIGDRGGRNASKNGVTLLVCL